jgi:NAD(P)-dependent dehydrogenase (short-subunit alcohol dehydrogenase family)
MAEGSMMSDHHPFRLDERVAFVSGAAGYLGQAMTRALLGAGAHVILNGRNAERLSVFRAELADQGFEKTSIACFDMGDTPAVLAFFSGTRQLDVLVNNAITVSMGTIATTSGEDFAKAYDTGVRAAFEAMRAAEPLLRKSKSASAINVASMYGIVSPDPSIYGESGLNSPPAYGPAKAALIQLTRYMACHWGPYGIRVNAIAPGPFPHEAFQRAQPAFVERLAAKTPLKRIGRAHEIGGVVTFLASDAASYITGAVLPVDGGWTAW